ncbi:hypothetical protein [Azospirillum agricola]|uniref:hypothetical protein n=1 Tax=Azospirillum agricola TaxID=1720247 RepID=UPI0015C41614|nr:hypothetical protein [Azospirillum agricola]
MISEPPSVAGKAADEETARFHPQFEWWRIREPKNAIEARAAFAQDTRFAVFRLLIQAGPNGPTAATSPIRRRWSAPGYCAFGGVARFLQRSTTGSLWKVTRNPLAAVERIKAIGAISTALDLDVRLDLIIGKTNRSSSGGSNFVEIAPPVSHSPEGGYA